MAILEGFFMFEQSSNVAEILITNSKFLVLVVIAVLAIGFLLSVFFNSKHVYLLDFMCCKAPETHRVPMSTFIEHAERLGCFDSQSVEFLTKVIERSGIGNETYLPTGLQLLPANQSLASTIEEVEMVLFPIVHDLFTKHGINPASIDILITNCSLVSPTPSLATRVINKFGLRSSIKSFNLSGMGCSAGLLSISLARDLLKVHNNSLVLVLSMESLCSNMYHGKIKSMLLSNCLFRMGGAAILLTNRRTDKRVAKYELQHLVRTHLGYKDAAYKCVFQEEDEEGNKGVALSRSILQVAGEALKKNLTTLAASALPYSELIRYGISILLQTMWLPAKKRGPYIPDFRKAFEHFCIHAGGKAVIDAIKESLNLKDLDVEASKMTLHRFGNTSSSSIWYSLSYLEAKGRVQKGERVWQLAFGSGFKCNSAVWKCISKTKPDDYNVWSNRINLYPVDVPDTIDHCL